MGGWKAVLNLGGKAVNFGGRTLKYGLHNPKTALGGLGTGVVAWKYFFNDQSLIEQATDVALGDDAAKGLKDGGVVGGLKSAVFGTDGAQRSIGENIVDGVVGDGTFHQIGQTAGNMIDSAGNVIHSAGQGVQQMFNGNNQITQMQGGGMQMPFNGIGQLVNSFWNGGSSLSLAALIPAAFLMFGNFGWMGKIASLFLGALAMRSMQQPAPLLLPQQSAYSQAVYQPQLAQDLTQPEMEEEENEYTIHRRRG